MSRTVTETPSVAQTEIIAFRFGVTRTAAIRGHPARMACAASMYPRSRNENVCV